MPTKPRCAYFDSPHLTSATVHFLRTAERIEITQTHPWAPLWSIRYRDESGVHHAVVDADDHPTGCVTAVFTTPERALEALHAAIPETRATVIQWNTHASDHPHRAPITEETAMTDLPESACWSYALSKQLSSAHTLASSYGDLELDEELREAVENALRPLLERRVRQADHGCCPDPLQALDLNLTPGERESLRVFVEVWHRHDSQAALADLVKRALRDVVNEVMSGSAP